MGTVYALVQLFLYIHVKNIFLSVWKKKVNTHKQEQCLFLYHIYTLHIAFVKTNFSIAGYSKISINLSTSCGYSLFLISTTISPSLYAFRTILFSSLQLVFATGCEDGFCAGDWWWLLLNILIFQVSSAFIFLKLISE